MSLLKEMHMHTYSEDDSVVEMFDMAYMAYT